MSPQGCHCEGGLSPLHAFAGFNPNSSYLDVAVAASDSIWYSPSDQELLELLARNRAGKRSTYSPAEEDLNSSGLNKELRHQFSPKPGATVVKNIKEQCRLLVFHGGSSLHEKFGSMRLNKYPKRSKKKQP